MSFTSQVESFYGGKKDVQTILSLLSKIRLENRRESQLVVDCTKILLEKYPSKMDDESTVINVPHLLYRMGDIGASFYCRFRFV
jgi:hypothetical protein